LDILKWTQFENHLAIIWIFLNLWDLKITPKLLHMGGKLGFNLTTPLI